VSYFVLAYQRTGEIRLDPTSRAELIAELQKNPVDGFSAGLVDDENMLEWQIVIMG
jgi:hypothetical protein